MQDMFLVSVVLLNTLKNEKLADELVCLCKEVSIDHDEHNVVVITQNGL